MLHAFDASANNNVGGGGTELFAYVPNSVISTELASLTSINYAHKYFVDGAPQQGDAFFTDNNWHTVLVGTMGAGSTTAVPNPDANNDGTANDPSLETGTGGRGIFALDIANPTSFDEGDVLWEFTNRQDAPTIQPNADVDLGYTIPAPLVVRMNDGKWRVILANGYNSPAGKVVLFILDAQTGEIVQKLTAEQSLGGNGLSTPTAYDSDGDSVIDYIYAGDLKGNMWKFDVTATTPGAWGIAYSPVQPAPPAVPLPNVPVFTACYSEPCTATNRQPITAKPTVVKANAAGQTSGAMIYFGTGKYFEDGDHTGFATSPVDTFYGLWDVCDKTVTSCIGNIPGRSNLQQQSITNEFNGDATLFGGATSPRKFRVTSDCEVAFGTTTPTTTTSAPCNSVANRLGWYMNLIPPTGTGQGERVVNTTLIRNGVVIFTTLIPISSPCKPDGTGWLMEVATSGSRLPGTNFDANKDGLINENDMIEIDGKKVAATGLGSEVGIIDAPVIVDTGNEDTKYLNGSNVDGSQGGIMDVKESPKCTVDCSGGGPGVESGSRESWRQLR
jgi:type IV pilus assembly protein PilY1